MIKTLKKTYIPDFNISDLGFNFIFKEKGSLILEKNFISDLD